MLQKYPGELLLWSTEPLDNLKWLETRVIGHSEHHGNAFLHLHSFPLSEENDLAK